MYVAENDVEDKYIYVQTFDRETIKKLQDEVLSDPNKAQVSYLSTLENKYFNKNAWKK